MEERIPRKLAAILYADVAGYSRLTGEDEDATHKKLSAYLDYVSAAIGSHSGQVMHFAGDAVLAKFDAVVDALSAALEIQRELTERNEGIPDSRKIQFRIGINLGDVIEDRGDIYGDGVNVAARLEGLADPGGICVSDAVRLAAGTRLDLVFQDMGEQEVKNISVPVRAHKVVTGNEVSTGTKASAGSKLELPFKPSIAVLPFNNMSGDPEQEYFSDGITEDIITELSRFRGLFVIARNSSFSFKGKNVEISEMASSLGVQYLVEGSVRKSGNRVRVTAQLIDGVSGAHVWADRYDRVLEDIFSVQDEIVTAVVSALPGQIRQVELTKPKRGPSDIRAYDLVLHAPPHTFSTREGMENGIALLEQALEIEPDYAAAHGSLAAAYAMESDRQLGARSEATVAKIVKHARRAVELDPSDDQAYYHLSDVCLFIMYDLAEARIHAEKAVSLNPNATVPIAWRGYIHNCDGETDQAIALCTRAIRLDPLANGWVKFLLGVVYFDAGSYDAALEMFLVSDWEEKWPHLAAVYALTGETERAQEIAKNGKRNWFLADDSEDVDELLRQSFESGDWYTHGNRDGSFLEGMKLAGLF